MSRSLTWINLAGVAVLAGLCGFQWRANRALNLDVNALQKTGIAQAARIAEQDKTLAGLASDLDSFRTQLTAAHAQLRDTSEKLHTSETAVSQLTAERDQLKEAIATWTAAVQIRDERITEANDRIREVGGRLQEAVEKFNELATRYNDSVQKYNELSARYNTVVQQLNEARGVAPTPDSAKKSGAS